MGEMGEMGGMGEENERDWRPDTGPHGLKSKTQGDVLPEQYGQCPSRCRILNDQIDQEFQLGVVFRFGRFRLGALHRIVHRFVVLASFGPACGTCVIPLAYTSMKCERTPAGGKRARPEAKRAR